MKRRNFILLALAALVSPGLLAPKASGAERIVASAGHVRLSPRFSFAESGGVALFSSGDATYRLHLTRETTLMLRNIEAGMDVRSAMDAAALDCELALDGREKLEADLHHLMRSGIISA